MATAGGKDMEAGMKPTTAGPGVPAARGVKGRARFISGMTLAILWLVLSWMVWVVALGGLCAAQARCNSSRTAFTNAVRIWAPPANWPVLACSDEFRFEWWVISYDLVVLVIASVCLSKSMKYLATSRAMLVGFLSIAIVLSVLATNNFDYLRLVAGNIGSIHIAARVAFGGFLMLSATFFFLLYMVGVDYGGFGLTQ